MDRSYLQADESSTLYLFWRENPIGRPPRGRPRKHREDQFMKDIVKMRITDHAKEKEEGAC